MSKKCTWPRFRMDNGVPCGPTNSTATNIPCCVEGDICVSHDLCRYTHSIDGGSGFYAAGCTDEEFSTSKCSKRCEREGWPDVVYEESSSKWKCCGADEDNHRNCEDPTDDSFRAPPPNKLIDYWTAGQTDIPWTTTPTATTSRPIPTSTSSPTSTSASFSVSNSAAASTEFPSDSPSSSSEGDSGLSTGAKAGIGAGVGVGALVVIIALVFWFWKRKQQKPHQQTPIIPINKAPGDAPQAYSHEQKGQDYYAPPVELPAGDRPAAQELNGTR